MQLAYPIFYRTFGVRRAQNLLQPKVFPLKQLSRDAVLHYLTQDSDTEIDPNNPLFKPYTGRVMTDFVSKIPHPEGSATRNSLMLQDLSRDFLLKNKHFQFKKDAIAIARDPMQLVVLSYNYLKKLYKYPETQLTEYYKWKNTQTALWDTIASTPVESTRNHFVVLDVPNQLPSRSTLIMFEDKVSSQMTKIFDTAGKLLILEIWKWLDIKLRGSSVFGRLKEDQFRKVTLVFRISDGRSLVLNMGYLNSWITGQKNQTEFSSISQYRTTDMQKIFLSFLLGLQSQAITDDVATPREGEEDPEGDSQLESLTTRPGDTEMEEHDVGEEDTDVHSPSSIVKSPKTASASGPLKAVKDIKDTDGTQANINLEDQLKDLDGELEALEVIERKQLKSKGVEIKNNQVVEVEPTFQEEEETPVEQIRQQVFKQPTAIEALQAHLAAAAEEGRMSAADYRKFAKAIEEQPLSKDPFGSNQPLAKAMLIKPEDLVLDKVRSTISSTPLVLDTSMNESTLLSLDYDYNTKFYRKDVLSMVHGIQKAGVLVRKHEIEETHSALGAFEMHTFELKPVDGQASSIRVKLPKIDEDGSFVANSNKYIMRKQRVDRPIRKISPDEVSLSSYYGKSFVNLTNKKANSSTEWIMKFLNRATIEDHPLYKNVAPAMVFDNNFAAPFIYNAMASRFKGFDAGDVSLTFDHSKRESLVPPGYDLRLLEDGGRRLVGIYQGKRPIVVTAQNEFVIPYPTGVKQIPDSLGDIYDIMKLDRSEAPVDFTEVRVFSKSIPVGVFLAFHIGFKKLVKLLGASFRIVEGRKQKGMSPDEYAVSFQDVSYIFTRKDKVASLLLSGFNEFDKQLKMYQADQFNSKDVYFNLLESKGLSAIYFREMELINTLFVDPITLGILEELKEPTTYLGLLIKATEMLQSYHHPDSQDTTQQRLRGYERFSGTIYKEMVTSIRQFRNKNLSGKAKIEMSPYQVWQGIMSDPSVKMVEDINPIQNLKGVESVTYVGVGGRAKDAMNKASRAYHTADMGIVSEATVDSSDVGINVFLSANPNLKDIRGLGVHDEKYTAANLLSTSALLAPGATNDDARRTGFVSVQQGHTLAAKDYSQPHLRTGYEYVIGQRTSDMFCYAAKQDGKVISKTDSGVIVEYADGSTKGVSIGRQYGRAEGSTYPHDIVSHVEVGQKFKKGKVIAYNTGFFEQDILDPTQVVFKTSMLATTVMYESPQTHEDSSAISKELSNRMSAKTTKVKSYTVNFGNNLLSVVKPGQSVSPRDVLMIIEDEITSNTGAFDEASLATLAKLSNMAPKASYLGVVDHIEIFYHGDKADMSASIRALADRSDRIKADQAKSTGKPVITGAVNEDYRVSGVPLSLDKAEIRFYITVENSSGVGDKSVFANQLKTVVGEVMDYDMHTESGVKIEAVFGFRSAAARIVSSPVIIGTTIGLLQQVAKKMVEAYNS